MELSELNLLDTLSSEKLVLLGDFNTDLLKYDQSSNIFDFLDLVYSSLLLPTHTTTTSATLIDNVFTNNYSSSFFSGNVVSTLSDTELAYLR